MQNLIRISFQYGKKDAAAFIQTLIAMADFL